MTATTYLPILEDDFSVKVNKMSKFLNSIPFSFHVQGKFRLHSFHHKKIRFGMGELEYYFNLF